MSEWHGKRVLVTGICGTVGAELLRQLVQLNPGDVIGLDNNESELFFLDEQYRSDARVRFYLGDVRDRDHLKRMMDGVDIVLHTAALKHVILNEHAPREAIQTNIQGTQNVIDGALDAGVERVIFTSSDKAVNPTSVMGTSKLMGERLITAANALRRGNGPIFASTRFGNVLGSRGSVIPLFKQQIAAGKPITLTDPMMTRFIMTLEEAVRLVLESVFLTRGGEVFVTKMPVLRIADLAQVMVEELAPDGHLSGGAGITIVGVKPGEKLYEELLNTEEIRRTVELDRYFVILPPFKSVFEDINYEYPNLIDSFVPRPYNSANEPAMDIEELRLYLRTHGLLSTEIPSDRLALEAP